MSSGRDVLIGAAGLLRPKELVEPEGLVCVCGYEGAGAMCRPSLEPGGVSSPAEAEALADAEADWEVVMESLAEGA